MREPAGSASAQTAGQPGLVRGIGLRQGIALNMINMIGVGPFITLPLIVVAMHGPQAILGWVLGALLAACDGLVWAELGAAMPEAGGSYFYLKTIYGPKRMGRFLSFLFIWQLTFSAPLSIASGCVGLALYAGFLFPALRQSWFSYSLPLPIPVAGSFRLAVQFGPGTVLAMLCCLTAVALLYRNIQIIGRVSSVLWIGVMGTLGAVIVTGLTHFNAHQAFSFPPGAFAPSLGFFAGLGSAALIATYDYWGAYSICFLGGEVRNPGYTIPRAVLWSVALVAALYLMMNVSVLGVLPWQWMVGAAGANARLSVAAVLMQTAYGAMAGCIIALLVVWTAFASVYALLLAYSRVPYAAALDGNYFRVFARVHPRHRFPYVSLLVLGAVATLFCVFQLVDLLAALVVIRILLQFLLQHVGLIVLRRTQPRMNRPFRVWLYPWPVLIAIGGFVYILFARPAFERELFFAALIVATGTVLYLLRALRRHEWPFGPGTANTDAG
ncbi:MAG TPA: APC family permease [Terracidiphilus sp.]|nr:APC family permease [Terracidiphilus sp.]